MLSLGLELNLTVNFLSPSPLLVAIVLKFKLLI